jgi:hypothetical protein
MNEKSLVVTQERLDSEERKRKRASGTTPEVAGRQKITEKPCQWGKNGRGEVPNPLLPERGKES